MAYPVDPEIAAIEQLLPKSDMTDLHIVREMERQMMQQLRYPSGRELTTTDVIVPGLAGNPGVPVRVTVAADRPGPVTGLLYLRPGGYVMGDISTRDDLVRAIADQADVAVISVGYRSAPEHPYPAALDDSRAVLEWAASPEAARHGVDPGRIAVMGDSAGGGLAAALTMSVRDHGGPAVMAQFLDAPTIDDRLDTPSMKEFTDTPLWGSKDAPVIWDYYLGSLGRGSGDVPRYAAPARATVDQLTGLPPTWVATYQLDPTRDEVLHFAERLMLAGVATELHSYSGVFHMIHAIPGTRIGARMLQDRLEAVRRMLDLAG